jgi:hypothetical protein
MSSKLPCRFLRPATIRSFPVSSRHAHARFFSASRAVLSRTNDPSNDFQHRISKLQAHGDLADYYPRTSELPSHRKFDHLQSLGDYDTLSNGETAKTTYGIHGRVMSVRRAGSNLVFIDLKRPSSIAESSANTTFQIVVNYGRLGIDDKPTWKKFQKVVRVGDWISECYLSV